MRQIISILSVAMVLVSCKGIEGTLNVQQDLTIKTKKSSSWCNPDNSWENCDEEKILVLKPGGYKADFMVTSNNSADFSIVVDSKTEKLAFELPKGVRLPGDNGSFSYSAAQIGQAWDLNGKIHTTNQKSGLVRELERCYYEDREWVCRPNQGYYYYGNADCAWFPVQRWGWRQVEYYYSTTNQELDMNMMAQNATQVLANFAGQKTWTDKIYTFTGYCR